MSGQPGARLGRDSLVMFAVQATLLLSQLLYGAYTARRFDPAVFGAYAIAMACASFASRVVATGTMNAAARRPADDVAGDRQLVGWATGAAALVTAAVTVTSPLLAAVWDDPAATVLIAASAPMILFTAYSATTTGILRRLGRIRAVSMLTLVTGIVGLAIGAGAVISTGSPISLVVVPLVTPALLGAGALWLLGQRGVPSRPVRDTRSDVAYSLRSSANSVALSALYLLPLVVLGRIAGAATLGSWNRAIAFAQVPLETAVKSWSLAAFPQFRTAEDGRGWTPLVGTGLLVGLPAGMALAPAIPVFMAVLLGPGWEEAEAMSPFLWMASVVTAIATLLMTAAESTAKFSILAHAQVALAVVLGISSLLLWYTGNWYTLAVGVLVAAIAYLTAAIGKAGKLGLLSLGRCFRMGILALLAGVGLLTASLGVSRWLDSAVATLSITIPLALAWVAAVWLVGRRRASATAS